MANRVFEKNTPSNHITVKSNGYYKKGDSVFYNGVVMGFADYDCKPDEMLSVNIGVPKSKFTIPAKEIVLDPDLEFWCRQEGIADWEQFLTVDEEVFILESGFGSGNGFIWRTPTKQLYGTETPYGNSNDDKYWAQTIGAIPKETTPVDAFELIIGSNGEVQQ